MNKPFTGRHMTMIMLGGFGIVIAVNLFMATLAIGGFSGVVVKNTYVASQQFNGWLDQKKTQDALGWDVTASRTGEGTVRVTMRQVPEYAQVTGTARRPLGKPERRDLAFTGSPAEGFQSLDPLPEGRWLLRLSVVAGDDLWRGESELR